MSKVSVQIVTWNAMNFIFDCLESLMRQSFRDFSVIVIDNGSDDGTVEFVRANYPTVSVLENFKNLGFTKANNQGILLAKSEYVLTLNADVILSENFLERLLAFADTKPDAGSFGGKAFKLYSEPLASGDEISLREVVRSNILDTTGLQIFRSRRVIDRGEGEKDTGQYDRREEVFGICGACALYRQSALAEVAIKKEYFDNDFFAYKEDVDLAWRLRLYGFAAWYIPDAVFFHHRQLPTVDENNLVKAIYQRQSVSKFRRALSFRNQHLLLVKNDLLINLLFALPWWLLREVKIILAALILEPFQGKSLIEFFQLLPNALLKRRVIMAHRKVSAKEIRKWFR